MPIIEALFTAAMYALPFAFLMGVVVAVHEWGHYYAARIIGVHATEFAIGMGPTVLGRRDRNGCHWQIKALPIGGYVRFKGEADASFNADVRQHFDKRSPGDRAFVIAAGPALNLLFGIVVIAALYATNGRPYIPPVISQVAAGMPAEQAGMLPGDVVTSVNGMKTDDFTDVVSEISMYPESTLRIEATRNGEPLSFVLTTERSSVESFGTTQTVGKIGISTNGPVMYRQIGPSEAILIGAQDVVKLTRGMGIALAQMVTGERSAQEMGGPIKIAEMSGSALRMDVQMFVFLIAAISVNLGIMNLLPLPVLDGGQLVVCTAEKIIGRPLGEQTLGYIYKAGAAFLVFGILALTFNDIIGIIARVWI